MKIANCPPFIALIALLIGTTSAAMVHGSDQDNAQKITVLRIKGSTTLSKALKEWSQVYQANHSNLQIELSGGGSGNGIAALINGHVEIASSSRMLRSREIHLFNKKHSNVKPIGHMVALDAVSIVVHASNPINGISLNQLMSIYERDSPITHWTDLGVQVPGCENQKILPLNRKNNSGTYDFFRKSIFNNKEHFDSKLISMDASDTLVTTVSQNPCAIGYSGMPFITSQVKTLCVSKKIGSNTLCVPPSVASTLNNSYPLARALYMYTRGEPQGEVKNFLDWIKGPKGREILLKAGYVLPAVNHP